MTRAMRSCLGPAIFGLMVMAALGLGYVGLVLVGLAGFIGPRGDIDFVDTPAATSHAVVVETGMRLLGLACVASAVAALAFGRRLSRWVVRQWIGPAPIDPTA